VPFYSRDDFFGNTPGDFNGAVSAEASSRWPSFSISIPAVYFSRRAIFPDYTCPTKASQAEEVIKEGIFFREDFSTDRSGMV